jgi:Protein similar to CwfJ C-terminus 1
VANSGVTFSQILPIAHHPTSLEIPDEVSAEIEKFKSALKKCFKKHGQEMVFFERNYRWRRYKTSFFVVLSPAV